MGIREAKEDGIRYTDHADGCNWFFPKCHICGAEVPSWNYRREIAYTCKKCRLNEKLSDKKQKDADDFFEKEKKFENAVKRIQSQNIRNFSAYEKAETVVHDKLHTHGWFESTEEIMVAIELLRRDVKTRHQVQLGRYRADFVLPYMNVVLECDGRCYHNEYTRGKEEIRDSLIVAALGPKWEVIRITDDLINQNIKKLVPAIREIKKKRKLVREKNGGYLPEWYTDRKMA